MSQPSAGRERRQRADRAAETFGGVLSRALLRDLGVDRHAVRHEVDSGRWRTHGHQTVALHTGGLSVQAVRWRAVWEVGAGIAALDGVSALQAAGLTGFSEDRVHVSIPHACRPHAVRGVRTHRVRSRLDDEVIPIGPPRVRPAIAAIRAAHWAATDRQAALILCMVVQQGIVTPAQLYGAAAGVTDQRRRGLVAQLVADIGDGVHSLGELDFAAMCRARGLPRPSRQVARQGPRGRIYLDVRWDGIGLVVEIDGAQHRGGLAVMEDNLRRNAVVLEGDLVLRIDLIGLRLAPGDFMDQVCAAHSKLAA